MRKPSQMIHWIAGVTVLGSTACTPNVSSTTAASMDVDHAGVRLEDEHASGTKDGRVVHNRLPMFRGRAVPTCEATVGRTGPRATLVYGSEVPNDDRGQYMTGSGVTVEDLDGDGQMDLILPQQDGITVHWGDVGLPSHAPSRLPMTIDHVVAVLPIHLTDGQLPALHVLRSEGQDLLLRQPKARVFASDAGFFGAMDASSSASWADIDLDGDLDVFIGSFGYLEDPFHAPAGAADRNRLLRNDGAEGFTNISDTLPRDAKVGWTWVTMLQDLNDDGYPDLYVVNDFGTADRPSRLLWNDQGRFGLDGGEAGLDLAMSGMGIAAGDLNGDGLIDLGLTDAYPSYRAMMQAGGMFFDASAATALQGDTTRMQHVGWGTDFGDLDNDGDLDVLVGHGHMGLEDDFLAAGVEHPMFQTDALFINTDAHFDDVAFWWGVNDRQATRGALLVDVDQDGWLDVVTRAFHGQTTITLSECGDAHWTHITLDGTSGNPRGIGAEVSIETDLASQVHWVRAGSTSFASSRPAAIHAGLGDADRDFYVHVTWPDGARVTYTNLPVDRALTLRRDGSWR